LITTNIASSVGRGASIDVLGSEKTFIAFRDSVTEMLAYEGEIFDTRMIAKINRFLEPPKEKEYMFQRLSCDNPFCNARVTMISIQNDGSIYPCGCAGSSGNIKKFKLGDIQAVSEISNNYLEKIKLFHQKKQKYNEECIKCPARFVCEHGCPAFDHTDFVTPENTCQATKWLYQYLLSLDLSSLQNLVDKYVRIGNIKE